MPSAPRNSSDLLELATPQSMAASQEGGDGPFSSNAAEAAPATLDERY